MGAQPVAWWLPFVPLLLIGLTDLWVYQDASRRADHGRPVVAWSGQLRVESPAAWALGTLVLWVLFFPLYLLARRVS